MEPISKSVHRNNSVLLECRQQTKKKTKTKPCQNQRVHYRKKRVDEGGQGMFEIVETCVLSHVWLFASSWTVACQASVFMTFSRQEYWSGLLFSILSMNLLSCNQSYQSSWSFKLLLSWEDLLVVFDSIRLPFPRVASSLQGARFFLDCPRVL